VVPEAGEIGGDEGWGVQGTHAALLSTLLSQVRPDYTSYWPRDLKAWPCLNGYSQ